MLALESGKDIVEEIVVTLGKNKTFICIVSIDICVVLFD